MAVIRKKYFSLAQSNFVDLPTSQSVSFDTRDISTGSNPEKIRLIPFGDFLSTGTLTDIISDLVYNDLQVLGEAQSASSIMSDGVYESSGSALKIEPLTYINYAGEDYIKKFIIRDGQLNYKNQVVDLSFDRIGKITTGSLGSNSLTFSTTNSGISVGDIVRTTGIDFGTQVISLDGVSGVSLSNNLNESFSISNGDSLFFSKEPVFEVSTESPGTLNFEDITLVSGYLMVSGVDLNGIYPRYRRDVIEVDTITKEFFVEKGPEASRRPPINTQLDSRYQIKSIQYQSSVRHRIYLKDSQRTLSNDLEIGSEISIIGSTNKIYDGDWVIKNIGSDLTGRYVEIDIPEFRDDSKDQNDPGGYVEFNRFSLYSVLLYKPTPDAPTLILDEIQRIADSIGLFGETIKIVKAELNRDQEEFYGVETRKLAHLTDSQGRLLDWEYGQDANVLPQSAGGYTVVDQITESQVQFPNFENLNKGTSEGCYTNVPFIIKDVNDNVFNKTKIELAGFNVGIKNTPESIGNEGLEIKISSAEVVFSFERAVTNSVSSILSLSDSGLNFLIPINSYQVKVNDFIYIVSGAGVGQVARITAIAQTTLTLVGLSKRIDNTSRYVIFKNDSIFDISNSQATISSSEINSQVISGVNGKFGTLNAYRKVYISYTTPPEVELGRYYFLRIRGYNEGATTWNSTPLIVTENPIPRVAGDLQKLSTYHEIFYRTFQGLYPSGEFLIEDEFGDISISNLERTIAPHFRPARYQITARALDYTGAQTIPPAENIAYVDVHTGRVRFYPGAEPRRVYLSYYKNDYIDGKATGYSIKHSDYSQDIQINVQDKITEIDNRFEKGARFKKPVTFNGINSSFPTDGFKGPFSISPDDPFKLQYVDSNVYNNFNVDEQNYIIKLTNHYYDDISAVDKDGVYTTNDLVNLNEIVSGETINSTLDFLDWKAPASRTMQGAFNGISSSDTTSGTTLNKPSINFYDEFIVPKETTFNSSFPFLKKRFFDAGRRQFEFVYDEGFVDNGNAETVAGTWNDIHSTPFNKFQTIRSMLRKGYWESLTGPFPKEVQRRFKQRESVRIVDNQLKAAGSLRSQSVIVSQPYLSKQKVLSSGKFKNHYLYAAAENVNIARYKKKLNSSAGSSFEILGDIDHYDAKVFDEKLYISYIDPTTNEIKVQNRNLVKDNSGFEYNELTSISSISDSYYVNTPLSYDGIRVSIIDVNKYVYAILYIYNDGILFRGKIQLRSKNTNELVSGSDLEFTDSSSDTIYPECLFDFKVIADNKIAVLWKKNISSLVMKIYSFIADGSGAQISEEISVENTNTIDAPKIVTLSYDRFAVIYSTVDPELRLRMFNFFGDLVFFDEAKTIPYIVISAGTQITGYSFDVAELQNNNLMISYIDNIGTTSGFLRGKLKTFYYDTFSLSPELTFGEEFSSASRNENYSIRSLNENLFVITYIEKSSNKVMHKFFYLNGLETREESLDSSTNRENIKLVIATEHGYFNIYRQDTATVDAKLKLELNEFRPDETESFITNDTLTLTDSFSIAKSINFEGHRDLLAYAKSSGGYVRVIHKGNENAYEESSVYSILNFSDEEITHLDVIRCTYDGISSKVDVLVIGYVTSDNKAKVKIYNIGIGTFTEATSTSNKIEISDSHRIRLVNLGLGKVLIVASTQGGEKTKIHSLLLNSIDETSGSWTLNTTTTSIVSDTPIELDSQPGEIEVLKLQDLNGYCDSVAVFRKYGNALKVKTLVFKHSSEWTGVNPNTNKTGESSDITVYSSSYDAISLTRISSNANLISKAAIKNGSDVAYVKLNFNNITTPTASSPVTPFTGTVTKPYIIPSKDKSYSEIYYCNSSGDIKFNIVDDAGSNTGSVTFGSALNDQTYTTGVSFNESINGVSFYSSVSGTPELNAGFVNSFSLGSSLDYSPVFDYASGYATRLYSNIKIGGIDFRGEPLQKTIAFEINTNIQEDQITNNETYVSKMLETNFHIVNFTNDKFSIIMHCSGETASRNKIYVRHFRISRNRIFAVSSWLESFDFDYESNIQNLHLKVASVADSQMLLLFRDPSSGRIRRAVISETNTTSSNSLIGFNGEEEDSDIIPIALDSLVEGWIGGLLYDRTYKKYWTIIFNPDGNVAWKSESFTISQFDRTVDLVSDVKISPYGYFYTLYIDSSGNYKYLQHGWDGGLYGSVQIIGKNFVEAVDTNPESFIEKSVFRQIEKIKFFNEVIEQASLDGDNTIILNHNLGIEYPIVQMYDNSGYQIIPTEVKSIDSNSIKIDLSGYAPITGAWRIRII